MEQLGVDLVLIGGDMTRDGDPHEYELQAARDDFDSLPFPYRAVPGNVEAGNKHSVLALERDRALECTSVNLERWSSYFGPANWSVVHRNVRLTGFYAGVAGSGLEEEQAFWQFMEQLPELPELAHHVALMHYPLFVNAVDEPNYDPSVDRTSYGDWYNGIDEPHRSRIFELLKRAGVDIVLSGHVHNRRDVREEGGIRFCWAPACGGRPQYEDRWPDGDGTVGFMKLDVTDENISIGFIPVDPVSTAEDRGPYGHFYTNDHAAKGFPDEYDHLLEKNTDEEQ
jgi:3',5'-cyclic AMP phosphodiesterase CpdA